MGQWTAPVHDHARISRLAFVATAIFFSAYFSFWSSFVGAFLYKTKPSTFETLLMHAFLSLLQFLAHRLLVLPSFLFSNTPTLFTRKTFRAYTLTIHFSVIIPYILSYLTSHFNDLNSPMLHRQQILHTCCYHAVTLGQGESLRTHDGIPYFTPFTCTLLEKSLYAAGIGIIYLIYSLICDLRYPPFPTEPLEYFNMTLREKRERQDAVAWHKVARRYRFWLEMVMGVGMAGLLWAAREGALVFMRGSSEAYEFGWVEKAGLSEGTRQPAESSGPL